MKPCRMSGALGLALASALLADPGAAQTPVKTKPGKEWRHPHSKIVTPASLAGFNREQATDLTEDFLDVAIQYFSPDGADGLSVYIFRKTNGAVPVWFSQAQMAIEVRDIYAGPSVAIAPQAVPLPGRQGGQALRVVYRGGNGSDYASTGLAMFSVGQWYVKLRASSKKLSPEELSALMEQVLSELTLPSSLAPSTDLAPVEPCSELLSFPEPAQDAPKDAGAMLLSGIIGNRAFLDAKAEPTEADREDEANREAGRWCRDATFSGIQTLYRPQSALDRYLIAMGDSGLGVFVGPEAGAALMAQISEGEPPAERFSVVFHLPAAQVSFVAQDRLPSPERVAELINGNRRTMTVPTWGKDKNVRIHSDAM